MAQKRNWQFLTSCDNNQDFLELANAHNVSLRQEVVLKKTGAKRLFHCKNATLYRCSYQLKAISSDVCDKVDVFTSGTHVHEEEHSSFFLPKPLKAAVESNVAIDLTIPQIRNAIRRDFGEEVVSDTHRFNNLVQRSRKKIQAANPIGDLDALGEWCRSRSLDGGDLDLTTIDLHQPFVVFYDVNPDKLQIHLTTKQLMLSALSSSMIQTDCTNKVNWHEMPCIISGAQDKNRHFHVFLVSIVWKEEDCDVYRSCFQALNKAFVAVNGSQFSPAFVMGDGHRGISNAAVLEYQGVMRSMCYYHMKTRFLMQQSRIPEQLQAGWNKVINQVEDLQLAISQQVFQQASLLLVEKWKSEGLEALAEYFGKTWLGDLSGWYEGFAPFHPSTNNGVENINSGIKKHLFRRKEQFQTFLPKMEALLKAWSGSSLNKTFALRPTASLSALDGAWKWANQNPFYQRLTVNGEEVKVFLVRSSRCTLHDIAAWLQIHADASLLQDFPAYQSWLHSYYVVEWNDQLQCYTCTCRIGLKEYACKHSLGIEMILGIRDAPDKVKALPLNAVRRPGRPKKVGPALSLT